MKSPLTSAFCVSNRILTVVYTNTSNNKNQRVYNGTKTEKVKQKPNTNTNASVVTRALTPFSKNCQLEENNYLEVMKIISSL